MTTIDEVLDACLAEQEARLAERTFGNYLEVIDLFRRCMNDYGHTSLSPAEAEQWEAAYQAGDEDAFTRLFGPEKIPGEIGQFLGWYVIRKVMAGQELARAGGTVTKKLGKWLGGQRSPQRRVGVGHGGVGRRGRRRLPTAENLAELLYLETRNLSSQQLGSVPGEDWIEDELLIERVESAALWFEGGVGPVEVPKQASDLARPGWLVDISLARIDGQWRIAEVGNVYP